MLETKIKEYIRKLVQEMDEELDEITTTANIDGFNTPYAFLNKKSKKDKEKRKRTATQMGYTIVGEGRKPKRPVNRWLELKNDESRTPNQKLSLGLKELKYSHNVKTKEELNIAASLLSLPVRPQKSIKIKLPDYATKERYDRAYSDLIKECPGITSKY